MSTGIDKSALTLAEKYAESLRHRARDGRDGRDGELVEAADRNLIERMDFLVRQLDALGARMTQVAGRVDEVEARPHISEETVKQLNDGLNEKFRGLIQRLVDASFGEIRSRLVSVERKSEASPAVNSNDPPDSAKLKRLSEIVAQMGKYVGDIEAEVAGRQDELDRRYAEITELLAGIDDKMTDVQVDALRMKARMLRALKAMEADDDDADAA